MRGHPPDARATTGSRPSCWSSWSTLGSRRRPSTAWSEAGAGSKSSACGLLRLAGGRSRSSMALIPKRASASRHRCHSDPAILRYAPQRHLKAPARPELSFSGDPYCGADLPPPLQNVRRGARTNALEIGDNVCIGWRRLLLRNRPRDGSVVSSLHCMNDPHRRVTWQATSDDENS
jgi:hypothetical protein